MMRNEAKEVRIAAAWGSGGGSLAFRDPAADRELVGIPHVAAVSDAITLICEVRGRRVGVPLAMIHAASEVRKVGDRGTLIVEAGLARRLKLVD